VQLPDNLIYEHVLYHDAYQCKVCVIRPLGGTPYEYKVLPLHPVRRLHQQPASISKQEHNAAFGTMEALGQFCRWLDNHFYDAHCAVFAHVIPNSYNLS
jgi:hypothetical protein